MQYWLLAVSTTNRLNADGHPIRVLCFLLLMPIEMQVVQCTLLNGGIAASDLFLKVICPAIARVGTALAFFTILIVTILCDSYGLNSELI
jgi:hypothetical protein